jgi:hypothetical protein
MIAHGRDVYGDQHSPLFASALDRQTMTLPDQFPPIEGIRNSDRSYSGGNPMHDENFYLTLYELSKVTKDRRYANEADDALEFFFAHAQSPATGLFAWGEHMYWDFEHEAMGGNDTHEFYRPWVLTDASYELAPAAMIAYARGLWRHQIADPQNGYYSRHAAWSRHRPQAGHEFPRHGGFYIAQWAEAYERTRESEFLTAIDSLVGYFERVRNPKTNALPNHNPATQEPVVCWTLSQLSLSLDLWEASDDVVKPLAARMRDMCRKNDAAFFALPHDFSDPKKGFVAESEFVSDNAPKARGFCPTWASGYGIITNAQAAMMCYERYLQCRHPAYKSLVRKTADMYLQSEPDEAIELYPGPFGDAIFLMVAAHRLTQDPRYLERAHYFAEKGIALFWDDGPLPRASTRTHHYETITRADTLARALLVLNRETTKHPLSTLYIDR